jgi:hypothetical protein
MTKIATSMMTAPIIDVDGLDLDDAREDLE